MLESEDGTVTGSIDVSKLDQVEPKTDEARAQLDALKAEVQAGQEQADLAADRAAEQARAQDPTVRDDEEQVVTTEAGSYGNADGTGFDAQPADEARPVDEAQPADDEVDQLRAEAEAAGVKVDKRWGADRLRSEIDTARAQ